MAEAAIFATRKIKKKTFASTPKFVEKQKLAETFMICTFFFVFLLQTGITQSAK